MDTPDQALVATKVCMRWHRRIRKTGIPLEWSERSCTYVCPECKASYGRSPHPDLPYLGGHKDE